MYKLVCYDQSHANFDDLSNLITFVKKSTMVFEFNDLDKFEFEESDDLREFFED
ncbi:MAG TPA: hypothetical protein VGR54_06260 [Nitrosopumilaceae archaeon]|nr:hypothetical protein [Nitrosopumilaceae archaeon]